MSEADKAYKAALEIIAQVKAAGEAEVRLDGDEFNALDRVPPELTALTSLNTLQLSGTRVSDLASLQACRDSTSPAHKSEVCGLLRSPNS